MFLIFYTLCKTLIQCLPFQIICIVLNEKKVVDLFYITHMIRFGVVNCVIVKRWTPFVWDCGLHIAESLSCCMKKCIAVKENISICMQHWFPYKAPKKACQNYFCEAKSCKDYPFTNPCRLLACNFETIIGGLFGCFIDYLTYIYSI